MYGSFDNRGLRVPRSYSTGTTGYNTQNQYGAHNQGMTNDIGTTRSEQMMQGGMGGMSTVMRADYNTPGTHQQSYTGGNQYGSQYGNYGYQNQYGAHNQGMTNDIGTTRSEQMMQGGMGGMSTVMQADHNTAGTHQQSYTGGNQFGSQYGGNTNTQYSQGMYGGGSYGGNQYGSQFGNYGYQNQYGAHGRGMTNDIGTTRSEQMMQGGMGGMSTVMRADYNTPGTHQQSYTGGNQYGSQYGGNTNTQYSQGMYGGGSYGGNQYGSQFGNYGYQNQYGAHGRGMTNDIGTTRSEQMMQGGMGGMSTVMRADYNPPGTHQQSYTGGNQYGSQYGGNTNTQYSQGMYGGGSYGGNQYGSQFGNYGYQNQYGAHDRGMTNDIGTTRSEQMMQGGMGGMSTVMQADYNTPGTHQQSYTGGNQYGTQYGNYGYQNQYGAHSRGMTNDIGTTNTERMMQGGMGGMSTVMRADYNTAGTHQQNYTGGSQYGNYGYQSQYGTHNQGMTNDIGTTRSEQQMQGGMGGLNTAMSADYNTSGTHQQNYTSGTQYGGQNTNTGYSQSMYGGGSYQSSTGGNQGTYNPGDTTTERQAKQNMGVNTDMGGTYGNEF